MILSGILVNYDLEQQKLVSQKSIRTFVNIYVMTISRKKTDFCLKHL